MFSTKNLSELLLILNVNSKTAVKFARETWEILFYRAVFLSFLEKVREVVGDFKYAIDWTKVL